ncbi:MAG: hypothetical protein HYS27_14760 [Deltaproteobacteria bacterium]|nr:hypothetical protein [Deltaproteobacteria bacterium]
MRGPLVITSVTLVVALSSAGAGLAAGPADAARSIAVLPLVASGLAADEIVPVEAVVRAAAERHYGARLLPARLVAERLERGGAKGLRCDRLDPACSAQLGAVCGVAQVVVASLSTAGGASRLSLHLIDVAEVAQLGHASGPVSAELRADEVLAVLRDLDAPAAAITSVLVTGPPGSLVVVDGADRGALPMSAPLTDLAPGSHEIGVEGPVTFRRAVELRRGEPVTLEVPAAAPGPPQLTAATERVEPSDSTGSSSPLLALAGGGLAAAAGAGAVAVGIAPLVLANLAAGRLAEREQRARADPAVIDDEAEQIRADHEESVATTAAWQAWGGITTVVGGAVVVAGLVVVVATATAWSD